MRAIILSDETKKPEEETSYENLEDKKLLKVYKKALARAVFLFKKSLDKDETRRLENEILRRMSGVKLPRSFFGGKKKLKKKD